MKPIKQKIPTDALVGRLNDLRGRLKGTAHGSPGDLGPVRQSLEALQTEVQGYGWPVMSDALRRLALTTEVWECLVGEGDGSTEQVASFCDRVLDHLARDAGREHDAEKVEWIARESSERWGTYLEL